METHIQVGSRTKQVSIAKKYHNHRPQMNTKHRKEETLNMDSNNTI